MKFPLMLSSKLGTGATRRRVGCRSGIASQVCVTSKPVVLNEYSRRIEFASRSVQIATTNEFQINNFSVLNCLHVENIMHYFLLEVEGKIKNFEKKKIKITSCGRLCATVRFKFCIFRLVILCNGGLWGNCCANC